MFENIVSDEIRRPAGNVDVLIGYRYAGYHPEPEQRSGHLLLLKNRFGRCLGGNHATLEQADADKLLQNAQVHHLSGVKVEDFFSIENLGVECTLRCGGCKCGKCQGLQPKGREGASSYRKQSGVWRNRGPVDRGISVDQRPLGSPKQPKSNPGNVCVYKKEAR